jgi:hypothetical protein
MVRKNFTIYHQYIRGRVSKYVTNVSKTAVMDVICFLCLSLGSSTVHLHDSLRTRRICVQRLISVVKMATMREECTTEEQSYFVRYFSAQNDSMQRMFTTKCLMFRVGSVYHLKWFTTGSRNSLKVVRISQWCPTNCWNGWDYSRKLLLCGVFTHW